MDGFPSGQRGQTVNLLQIASVVRIHLHPLAFSLDSAFCWCGGIGRRKGLKIPRGQPRAGSSPATSSKLRMGETFILQRFSYFVLLRKMYASVCNPVNPYSAISFGYVHTFSFYYLFTL